MEETRKDAWLSPVMIVGRYSNSDDYIITARPITRSSLLTDYNKPRYEVSIVIASVYKRLCIWGLSLYAYTPK
jgi:hypothetical protein